MARSFVSFLALAAVCLAPTLARAQDPLAEPAAQTLDPVVMVSASADIGVLQGVQNSRRVTGVYGPQGHVRAFVGYELIDEGSLRIGLGYSGTFGGGLDTITAPNPGGVFHTQQMVGLTLSGPVASVIFSTGIDFLVELEHGIVLPGWALEVHPGFPIGRFWIGIPLGLNWWPDWGVFATTFGVSVGGAML